MDNISVSDYTINSYKRMWGVRLISVLLCMIVVFMETKKEGLFEFYSLYNDIMDRSELFNVFKPVMTTGLIILFSGLGILFLVNGFLLMSDSKLIAIHDMILNILYILGIWGYALMYIVPERSFIIVEGKTIVCIVLSVIMLVIFIINMSSYKRNEDLFKSTKPYGMIVSCVLLAGVCIGSGCMLVKASRAVRDFAPNYGTYGKISEHSVVHDIENKMGNYRSQGVAVDGDIYYLTYDSDLKSDVIMRTVGDKAELFYNIHGVMDYIDYYDGYIYTLGMVAGEGKDAVRRINIQTGEDEIVLQEEDAPEKTYLHKFAIRDGMLYVLVSKNSFDDSYINRYDLSKEVTDENGELYLGHTKQIYSIMTKLCFYYQFVYDDSEYLYRCRNMVYADGSQQYNSDYFYAITSDLNHAEKYSYKADENLICRAYGDKDKNKKREIRESKIFESVYTIAEHVTAYNIYDDNLYYAQSTENGFEIYRADLDGSNATLIQSMDNGMRVSAMFVSEDKIVCTITNDYIDGMHDKDVLILER